MDEIKVVNNTLPQEVIDEVIRVEKLAEEYAKAQKKLRAAILEAMKEADVEKIDIEDVIALTVVPESTSERLDSKALKAELPDIYDTYCKISPKAAYLKVTVR